MNIPAPQASAHAGILAAHSSDLFRTIQALHEAGCHRGHGDHQETITAMQATAKLLHKIKADMSAPDLTPTAPPFVDSFNELKAIFCHLLSPHDTALREDGTSLHQTLEAVCAVTPDELSHPSPEILSRAKEMLSFCRHKQALFANSKTWPMDQSILPIKSTSQALNDAERVFAQIHFEFAAEFDAQLEEAGRDNSGLTVAFDDLLEICRYVCDGTDEKHHEILIEASEVNKETSTDAVIRLTKEMLLMCLMRKDRHDLGLCSPMAEDYLPNKSTTEVLVAAKIAINKEQATKGMKL